MTHSVKAWRRIPLLLRAIGLGLLVLALGSAPWGILVAENIRILPSLPWSALVMALYLVLYWQYLKGWGWPTSTACTRRESLRGESPMPAVWRWSLIAGGCGVASTVALFLVLQRLMRLPPSSVPDVSRYPFITIAVLAAMSAVVAGITEEAAFRGYMQTLLEQQYGPIFAICLTSVIFGLVHFSHGVSLVRFLINSIFGVVFGIVAYRARSILPGIVLHVGGDLVGFSIGRRVQASLAAKPLVWQTGPDLAFWLNAAEMIAFGALALWAFERLRSIRPETRSEIPELADHSEA